MRRFFFVDFFSSFSVPLNVKSCEIKNIKAATLFFLLLYRFVSLSLSLSSDARREKSREGGKR